MSDSVRYIAIPSGFLMVLRQGDNVFSRLEALMTAKSIPSGFISGFGFASKATFGFFDFEKKEYRPRTLESLEVTNLTGTMAWKDQKPALHMHAAAADDSFEAFGGHLLALEVGRGSFELQISVLPMHLERAMDPGIGANILQLDRG